MDDSFLMCVLNRLAHLDEELEPLQSRQLVLIAVLSDLDPPHQFHHEIEPASFGHVRVKNPGDVRVVHHCERLALGLEPRHNLTAVHAQFDYFQGHTSFYWLALL